MCDPAGARHFCPQHLGQVPCGTVALSIPRNQQVCQANCPRTTRETAQGRRCLQIQGARSGSARQEYIPSVGRVQYRSIHLRELHRVAADGVQ